MTNTTSLKTKTLADTILDMSGATDEQIEAFLEDTDWVVDHMLKNENMVGVLHLMGDENIHNNGYPVVTRDHILIKISPSVVRVVDFSSFCE